MADAPPPECDAELEALVDSVFAAMAEPGFRASCVDGLFGPSGGLLFLECPLAVLRTVAKLLPLTADRPPEQRFRPLLSRCRCVGAGDARHALGGGASDSAVQRVEALAVATPRADGFAALLSVALPRPAEQTQPQQPPRNIAFGARFLAPDGCAAVVHRMEGGCLACGPSLWAAEAPPPAPKPCAGAAAAAAEEEWLFCTHRGKGRSRKRPTFQWTGPLRPCTVSPPRRVPHGIARPDYAETGWPAEEMESRLQSSVHIHTPQQIEGIRAACRLGRAVLDACSAAVRPGVTTDEIDRICHEVTLAGGGYPSPLNYCSFPKSCCTSVNEVICHGIPDARPLEDGDIVNLDISVYLGGFHADLNETVCVGSVDAPGRALVANAWQCLSRAIAMVKPNTRFREIGDAISSCAASAGLSVVRTYCGHGIGELFHCAPNIPHYGGNKAVGVMKPGMVFTIEPMINAGSWKDATWPDGWTSVTVDGKRSAQFEHTLLVTDTGVEVLTARTPSSPPIFPFVQH